MLTHLNKEGYAKMVDVSQKDVTKRVAIASGIITMENSTIELIQSYGIKKGDVLSVAQVAGIMAVKKTSELIPMCHGISVDGCNITFEVNESYIKCICEAIIFGKTGIEMEVITGVSICLATIYDMCKAVDKNMVISDIKLLYKSGGKSGTYQRGEL